MDPGGLLAAVGGAVCTAMMVSSGADMAKAGVSIKAAGISMGVGLILGSYPLFEVHWSLEILVRGIIAGFLTVAGSVLFYVAQGPWKLPKRLASVLTANGPALAGLVGLLLLHQGMGLLTGAGIFTILAGSLLNAALTGSPEQKAAEEAKHTTARSPMAAR